MARRSGLGRGLSALIPDGDKAPAAAAAPTTTAPNDVTVVGDSPFREVPIGSITANTFQPRSSIVDAELEPLADSIRELGVLQPILVRETGGGKYELIAGERRWRAAEKAGLGTIPVLVRVSDDLHSLEQALVENLHRLDLNPIDEASAYRQLIDDFHLTHDELGKRMGKSRTAVTNLLRLLNLPPKIQKMVSSGEISEGHARALAGAGDDAAFQLQLAQSAANHGDSVRVIEDAVRSRNELEKPQTKKRKASKAKTSAPGLEWQERLMDHLDTRVSIAMASARGRIVIEFADGDDLDRIGKLITAGKKG